MGHCGLAMSDNPHIVKHPTGCANFLRMLSHPIAPIEGSQMIANVHWSTSPHWYRMKTPHNIVTGVDLYMLEN